MVIELVYFNFNCGFQLQQNLFLTFFYDERGIEFYLNSKITWINHE